LKTSLRTYTADTVMLPLFLEVTVLFLGVPPRVRLLERLKVYVWAEVP
jgi:hypothetical protein